MDKDYSNYDLFEEGIRLLQKFPADITKVLVPTPMNNKIHFLCRVVSVDHGTYHVAVNKDMNLFPDEYSTIKLVSSTKTLPIGKFIYVYDADKVDKFVTINGFTIVRQDTVNSIEGCLEGTIYDSRQYPSIVMETIYDENDNTSTESTTKTV